MQRLRAAFFATFAAGLGLLLAMPWVLAGRPGRMATQIERARYATGLTAYTMLLLLVLFAIIVLAWRVMVKQREAYREAAQESLRELIEGTLRDHEQNRPDA